MTWLAVCDPKERRLSLRGLGADKRPHPVVRDDPDTQLAQGTLLIEARVPADGRPQVLFGYRSTTPLQRSLTVQALPAGGVAVMQAQGDAICHVALSPVTAVRVEMLRISYAWDSSRDWAQLTLEIPGTPLVTQATANRPLPITLRDVRDLMLGRTGATFSRDMVFAALSDCVEPVGPMPGLLPSTAIATPWGARPVHTLKRGDTIETRAQGIVPVLGIVQHTLPARGSFRPIRLRAPYFGLRQDILVAPHQRLVLDGPEVEYLFGQEAALVPAQYLLNTHAAVEEPCGPTVAYCQLVLPRHEPVFASGAEIESLFIGRIRRDRIALGRSLCANMDRSTLPEHGRTRYPVLKWHEAVHLASRRAA